MLKRSIINKIIFYFQKCHSHNQPFLRIVCIFLKFINYTSKNLGFQNSMVIILCWPIMMIFSIKNAIVTKINITINSFAKSHSALVIARKQSITAEVLIRTASLFLKNPFEILRVLQYHLLQARWSLPVQGQIFVVL